MIRQLFARFRGSEFLKNSLTLSGGVALAQVLPFLFYPVLGRLFTAEEFGLLATLSSITSVLAVFGSGKYESGILIARDKLEAAHLAVLSVVLGLVTMAACWVIMQFLLAKPLSVWLDTPELGRWLYVCPLAGWFIIVFNVYNEWCVREKNFKGLSINKMINSGAIVLSKTALGFARICSQGLVLGDLIGRGISALGCIVRALLKDGRTFVQTRWTGLKECAERYREFPLYTMPGRLLNTLGQAFPIWVITVFFSQTVVGYFSMAEMIFAVPISIVGTSLGDVFRQRAQEEYVRLGNCLASYDKLLRLVALISVAALLVFIWFLPWMTKLFLGSQWAEAGRYAQILAPNMVLSFIANITSGIFIVAQRLRAFFYWQLYYAITTLVAVLVGGWLFGTVEATLILYAIMRSSAYVISIILTRRYAKGA